jgi:hypothetical protein
MTIINEKGDSCLKPFFDCSPFLPPDLTSAKDRLIRCVYENEHFLWRKLSEK